MEMEAPKDVIAPAVESAAMKLVCALVSRDTTEPDVNFRPFWKPRMVEIKPWRCRLGRGAFILLPFSLELLL
jgi:hypothetical protein